MESSSLQLVTVCVSIQTWCTLHFLFKTWCLGLLCPFLLCAVFLSVIQSCNFYKYHNITRDALSHQIKYDRLMPGSLAVPSLSALSQAQVLFGLSGCRSNGSRLFWTASASQFTFSLALQPDQRRAHLCVCHGLPDGSLPSPCLRAPLSAHDKKMHGNRHQAIWHVPICRERRVRNRVSRVLMKIRLPLFLEEQLRMMLGNL